MSAENITPAGASGGSADAIAALQGLADCFVGCAINLDLLCKYWTKVAAARAEGMEFIATHCGNGELVVRASWPGELNQPRSQLVDGAGLYAHLLVTQCVPRLHQHERDAQAAIARVPAEALRLLTALRNGRPWRPLVRRTALDKLPYWPDESGQRRRVPGGIGAFCELASGQDPRDFWMRSTRRLNGYVADVLAVAPELGGGVTVGDTPPVIPPEHRSRAMTKTEAAQLLRGPGNASGGREWLNQCIAEGTIYCESLSRTQHVFNVRQFPEEVRDRMRPK